MGTTREVQERDNKEAKNGEVRIEGQTMDWRCNIARRKERRGIRERQ